MSQLDNDADEKKRLRGAIIEFLYIRHEQQRSRPDHVMMWHSMRRLGFDIGENALVTALQDLLDRVCVKFEQKKNRYTNKVEISQIQLTPRGRDLFEGTLNDPAIDF